MNHSIIRAFSEKLRVKKRAAFMEPEDHYRAHKVLSYTNQVITLKTSFSNTNSNNTLFNNTPMSP
jgi:hypothetical protein